MGKHSVYQDSVIRSANFAHAAVGWMECKIEPTLDPGAKSRALIPGSRAAAFCFQIEDLDKKRTRDDNDKVQQYRNLTKDRIPLFFK